MVGVTDGRITQLIGKGVIPARAPLGAQLLAYTAHLRALATHQDAPEVTVERAKLLAAQAAREQIKLDEDRKAVIRVEAVRTMLASVLASTRDRLMQLPSRLAPVLAAESDQGAVHDAVRDEIHHALTELAAVSTKVAASPEA